MIPLRVLLACAAPDPTDPGEPPVGGPPGFERFELAGEAADRHRFWGAGLAALDLDRDGDLDLFVPGPHHARVLRRDGDGFTDLPPPERDFDLSVGASVADIDADGDLDVFVTRFGPSDVLLRNDDGVLVDVTVEAGLELPGHSQSSAWADLDRDGDLDLVVAGHGPIDDTGTQVVIPGPGDPTRIWLNDGAGRFVDASHRLPARARDAYTFVTGVTDLDADGWPDLLFANDYPVWETGLAAHGGPDGFSLDDGSAGLDLYAAGMGLAAADVNDDGVDDFLIPAWDRVVYLGSRPELGRWVDATAAAGFVVPSPGERRVGWGAEWADLDRDGDLDALVAMGHLDVGPAYTAGGLESVNALEQPDLAFEQLGVGEFVERAGDWGLDEPGVSRGLLVVDLDGDGGLDVLRRDLDGPIVWHRAVGGDPGTTVRVGPPTRAIGAEVVLVAGGREQRRTVRAGGTSLASGGPPEVSFGTGGAPVERVEVRFPDGAVVSVDDPPPAGLVVVSATDD